jgi:hypothetical protein
MREGKQIPYWVEREASAFRKEQRGEVAAEEQIDAARETMDQASNERIARGLQKKRKTKGRAGRP